MVFIEEIWIIGADHDLTDSTSALLHAASSPVDPISCVISAIASSYRPIHFSAAGSSHRQMQRTGTPDKIGEAIAQHKVGKQPIMGVEHRVYNTKDPRYEPVKDIVR